MPDQPNKQPEQSPTQEYVCAGSRVVPRFIAARTAEKFAAFFLPHLRPGMELLDCGCGPGSITAGLARAVAPGRTVGVDINPRQIEQAQTYAAEQDVPNLRFETASIYALPFPDGSFDAVFATSLVLYLRDPLAALREIYRVLKRGGMVGIREPDHEGQLCAPPDPALKRAWQLFDALVRQKEGNPNIGRHLRALSRQAGFVQVQASASFEVFSTPEATRQCGGVIADIMGEASFVQQWTEFGLAERPELERVSQAWRAWGENPDAFFADPFCEVVGWKE